jgi:FAD:protein FMN transferase
MFFGILCLLATTAAPTESLERFSATQPHMGTKFEIVLYCPTKERADEAFAAAFERIARLDAIMSDYNSNSELSKLSRTAPTNSPVAISEDLFRVLAASDALSRKSEGAFDVTVGPLTKLWRRARRKHEYPAEGLLDAARRATGYRNLKLDPRSRSVELLVPRMRLDLGGIAKGYAADEALEAMSRLGITHAIVNAGGDIVAGDAPPEEEGWRIGVASLEQDAPPSQFLCISNGAVATSGDIWQFVEIDGVRYSHILDPRTGLGLTNRSSVTIVAPTGIAADSLASAVSVLGPDAGMKLIERTAGTEALIFYQNSKGDNKAIQTSGFANLRADTIDVRP